MNPGGGDCPNSSARMLERRVSNNRTDLDGNQQINYFLSWFNEWSELQKSDFVKILSYLMGEERCVSTIANGGLSEKIASLNMTKSGKLKKLPSIYDCQLKLFGEWLTEWSKDQKDYIMMRLQAIDRKFYLEYEKFVSDKKEATAEEKCFSESEMSPLSHGGEASESSFRSIHNAESPHLPIEVVEMLFPNSKDTSNIEAKCINSQDISKRSFLEDSLSDMPSNRGCSISEEIPVLSSSNTNSPIVLCSEATCSVTDVGAVPLVKDQSKFKSLQDLHIEKGLPATPRKFLSFKSETKCNLKEDIADTQGPTSLATGKDRLTTSAHKLFRSMKKRLARPKSVNITGNGSSCSSQVVGEGAKSAVVITSSTLTSVTTSDEHPLISPVSESRVEGELGMPRSQINKN